MIANLQTDQKKKNIVKQSLSALNEYTCFSFKLKIVKKIVLLHAIEREREAKSPGRE